MKSRTQYKRKTPIAFLAFCSFLLVILLSFALVWFILVREYSRWTKDFEGNLNANKVVLSGDESLKSSSTKKLENFSKSTKKTDFVELSDTEFVYLVGESLDTSLPLNSKFEKGYVESNKGYWDIYVKTKLKNISFPWLKFRLEKDNTETAEIYITKMSIGNFDFSDYGAKIILDRVNRGIRESLVLVNESDFTGRVYRNIELEPNKIIIKGEK